MRSWYLFIKRAGELATLALRWFRPVTFVLLTVLFVGGYWFNSPFISYLEAVGKTPEWAANLITILVVGVASEKLARQIGDAVKVAKGKG